MKNKRRYKADHRYEKGRSARQTRTAEILMEIPENFALDLLDLGVACRYLKTLVLNQQVKRYLTKYRPTTLDKLEHVLAEFNS